MLIDVFYIVAGYLCGSVLFAEISAGMFGKKELLRQSKDGNPGTTSAFVQCGFFCGVFTLLGDILKGFLPVFCYLHFSEGLNTFGVLKMVVIAAPVLGHAFPLFYGFRGGKGIATSFGCLIALLPLWQPLIIQALLYVFFSLIVKISPHFYRTVTTYFIGVFAMLAFQMPASVVCGYLIIAITVLGKHLFSTEPRTKWQVSFLWKH